MKRAILGLVLFWFSISVQAFFHTGHDLEKGRIEYEKVQLGSKYELNAFTYAGYVLGVVDFMIDSGLVCQPNDLISGQVFAIVGNYVKANPEKWNNPAALLVFSALAQSYPCPTPKK